MLLEPASGGAVARVNLKPPVPRGRPPLGITTILEAADGRWTVHDVEAVGRHRKAHLAVRDGDGTEVATVERNGRIELGSETLVWEVPSLLPFRLNYRIRGLLVARPSLLTLGKGSNADLPRPFTVEVLPALANRPNASLILPLAAWLTWEHLSPAPA